MNKKCSKCGEVKAADCFRSTKKGGDKLRGSCRECEKKAKAAYRASPEGKLVEAAYRKTDKSKAIQKRWQQSDAGKASQRASRERIGESEARKASRRKYNTSDKAKITAAKYRKSESDLEVRARYARSEKGKAASERRRLNRRSREYNAGPTNWSRVEVHRDAKGNCLYCGISVTLAEMHADHFIPLSKGGSNLHENIVCSCPDCNRIKSDKMPEDFMGETL